MEVGYFLTSNTKRLITVLAVKSFSSYFLILSKLFAEASTFNLPKKLKKFQKLNTRCIPLNESRTHRTPSNNVFSIEF